MNFHTVLLTYFISDAAVDLSDFFKNETDMPSENMSEPNEIIEMAEVSELAEMSDTDLNDIAGGPTELSNLDDLIDEPEVFEEALETGMDKAATEIIVSKEPSTSSSQPKKSVIIDPPSFIVDDEFDANPQPSQCSDTTDLLDKSVEISDTGNDFAANEISDHNYFKRQMSESEPMDDFRAKKAKSSDEHESTENGNENSAFES